MEIVRGLCFIAAIFVLLAQPQYVRAQGLQGPRAQITPIVAADGVHPGGTVDLAILVRLPGGLHMNSNAPRDPSLIPAVLTVAPPAGLRVTEVVYPEATDLAQQGAEQPLAVYEREFQIGVRLEVEDAVPPGQALVPVSLRYQACDERVCYFPSTVADTWTVDIVPPATPVTPINEALFARIPFGTGQPPAVVGLPFRGANPAADGGPAADRGVSAGIQDPLDDPLALLDTFAVAASTGGYLGRDDFLAFIERAESGVQETGWFEGRGLLAVLAIVLVGGLALNLTPCVLPMIPINLAIIGAGARAGSRRRGFLLGTAYGAAMAVVYGTLGLVVILTAGTFGTINASPWFNAAIAAIFVVLGLAMFDVITIDFSRFSTRFNVRGGHSGGTFLVAFGMGAVAALLAGACVAPVVIQVVLFSSDLYASGTTAALALPFLLGVGMAIPWPVAGAGLSALPKPGAWMVRVKQAFGIVILGTAVYYGYVAYTLFADRWVDAADVAASVEEKLRAGWHASLGEGLTVARREQKPVLVDLWATWCKNCLVMDRTTLADPAVTSRLEGYVKVKFQAEDPAVPTVKAVMNHFGAIGLPTYVILEPRP